MTHNDDRQKERESESERTTGRRVTRYAGTARLAAEAVYLMLFPFMRKQRDWRMQQKAWLEMKTALHLVLFLGSRSTRRKKKEKNGTRG